MLTLNSLIRISLIVAVILSINIYSVGNKVNSVLEGMNSARVKIEPAPEISSGIEMPIYTGRLLSERKIAQIAWRYFKQNTQASTGLVNAVNKYPSTTMWDTASHLIALICAERLELISQQEFEARAEKALNSLLKIKLYNGQLPNKVYHSKSLAMVNYANLPTPKGIGWSAIDMARLMVPLKLFITQYPKLKEPAQKVFDRFQMSEVVKRGMMLGGRNGQQKKIEYVQEGRLGYEQYSAAALLKMNIDARAARRSDANTKFREIMGVSIAMDSRDKQRFGANVFTTSEPYLLFGLEFGFDADIKVMADNILAVQQERWRRTGILTGLTEDHINKAPYFVYNTIQANGELWASVSHSGTVLSDMRSLSTKAAIALHALYDTDYTRKLAIRVMGTRHAKDGWRSGIYEVDGSLNTATTVNTNAIILEAMHYRKFGPLLPGSTVN